MSERFATVPDVDDDPEKHVEEDWAWRRRLRANPHSRRIYRIVVALVGLAIVGGGLALIPLPGPGWVIVFVGLRVWASEFEWARRLFDFAEDKVRAWGEWLAPKPWWFKGVVALVTLALVLAIFYGLFLLSGVPGFLPDAVEGRIKELPGL